MHCISGPYNWVHPLNFRADMHTGVCGVPCMPISWRWQKHKQFALWPKNLTDVFQLQDKASPVELIREKREGESPPSHGYTPGTGISVDVVCELVTREIASKQTTESSPDNTWKRGGRCVCVCVCVCVCADGMRSYLSALRFASLSPISTWEDSRRAAVPLKSSQHVCLCQALACFRDYIFSFPFLNSPSRSPPRNSATTPLHLLRDTHTHLLWPCGEDYQRSLGQFRA